MKILAVVVTFAVVILCPIFCAMAGEMIGEEAEQLFSSWVTSTGGTLINFEDAYTGALLDDEYALEGVTFKSIRDPDGTTMKVPKPVVVVTYGGSQEISGVPSWGSGSDGRVAYEILFTDPQKWVGVVRHWNNYYTITNFYNAQGSLVYSFQYMQEPGFSRMFLGYLVEESDTSQWISRIECDGIILDESRQVGYSDNLYLSLFNIINH